MAETFARFRVGAPGAGASHASYITRASALEPDKQRIGGGELERNRDENSVARTLDDSSIAARFPNNRPKMLIRGGPGTYASMDEKWAKIYSEFAGERSA